MFDNGSMDEKALVIARTLLARPTATEAAPPVPEASPRRTAQTGVDYRRAALFVRWVDRLLRVQTATAHALADESLAAEAPEEPDLDPGIVRALGEIHRALLAHPVATKAAFRALLAEGRCHARTAEGAALRERLARSPEIRRASMLWRTLSLDMFDDDSDGPLPSTYVDHLLRVIDLPNPASVIGSVFATEQRPE